MSPKSSNPQQLQLAKQRFSKGLGMFFVLLTQPKIVKSALVIGISKT